MRYLHFYKVTVSEILKQKLLKLGVISHFKVEGVM